MQCTAFHPRFHFRTSRSRFLAKLDASLRAGAFVKLTLSEYRGAETGLRNVCVRAVGLRDGPHLSLVWRCATRA